MENTVNMNNMAALRGNPVFRFLPAALLAALLGLSGCSPTVQSGAINNTASQQERIRETTSVGTYLTSEELEDLEVPEDFLSNNFSQLVDILVPNAEEGTSEQLELMADSRYSAAIQWFESRYDPLSADFDVLGAYCGSLRSAERLRDAFNCAVILEKRLYHFVQSGAAEKFSTKQRALKIAGRLPLVGLAAEVAEREDTSFATEWLSVLSNKFSYYMAIRDFDTAGKYAREQTMLAKLRSESMRRNMGIGGSLIMGLTGLDDSFEFSDKVDNEALLGLVLAHTDREEALSIANRLATNGKQIFGIPVAKEAAGSIFFALEEYQRAAEIEDDIEYDPEAFPSEMRKMLALAALPTVLVAPVAPVVAAMHLASLAAAGATTEFGFDEFESESYKLVQHIGVTFRGSKIAYETGDAEKARKGYEELLMIPLIAEYKDMLSTIHHDLAKLEIQAGNDDKAVEHLYAGIRVIESIRANFSLETERIGFVGDKGAIYADLVATLTRQGQYAEAWEVAERAKARTLVELLAGQKRFVGTQDDDQLEEYLEELDRAEWGGLDLAYYRNLMAEQESADASRGLRRLDALRDRMRQADAATAALVTVTPQSAEHLQQTLGPDETLVEYFGVGDRYFIIVVDTEQVRVMHIDAQGLEDDVQAFRVAVEDRLSAQRDLERRVRLEQPPPPTSDISSEAAGQRLTERLWRPIAQYIQNEQVTIVPHGPLHYLPFSALPLSDDRRLVDTYSLRLLPSASVLAYLSNQPKTGQGVLVLGNPDLGDPSLDLPYAQQEASALGQILENSRVLLRNEATETVVKRFGSGFTRVHLASHGVFDSENPLQSGLLLAGDDENDGKFTVAELFQTRLDADLVTLSACETGLGKVSSGDDVVGFTRGFLYAGARSIVSSLWKVDDRATGELMQRFYAALERHRDKRQALREAQLELRKAGYAHPYYWAAFNIIGEAG